LQWSEGGMKYSSRGLFSCWSVCFSNDEKQRKRPWRKVWGRKLRVQEMLK